VKNMGYCEFCNEKIKTMPFKCKFCGRYFCIKNKLPENHNCEGLIIYEKYKLKNLEVERFKEFVNITKERVLTHLLWEYFKKRDIKSMEMYNYQKIL
jgi:hypothetical protein